MNVSTIFPHLRALCGAALLCVGLLSAFPASARQMQCAERAQVLSVLQDRLQQVVRARGIAGRAVMEMFVAPDSGDWTLTVTLPNGMTCLLANGAAFETPNTVAPARGAPV